jgi:hypothetical protein
MSKSKNNVITRGATGTFGKQVVFSQRFGETIMSISPGKRDYPPTKNQQQTRDRFKRANDYAKAMHANEALNAVYKAAARPGLSAYNIAMSDAFKIPQIKGINSNMYTGNPGDIISIHAVDNFKVQSVSVTILNGKNEMLEKGKAIKDPDSDYWAYTTVAALKGSRLIVYASDLPGNTAMMDLPL